MYREKFVTTYLHDKMRKGEKRMNGLGKRSNYGAEGEAQPRGVCGFGCAFVICKTTGMSMCDCDRTNAPLQTSRVNKQIDKWTMDMKEIDFG